MPEIWKKLTTVGALALALMVLGCEQTTEPSQQPQQVEVEAANDLLGGVTKTVGSTLGKVAGLDPVATVGETVTGLVSATLGAAGGMLRLGDHVLTVPPDAVSSPTTFTMRMVGDGAVRVEMHATRYTTNDVGRQGFDRPVRIALSYANTDADDPEDLVIVRVDDGEHLETHVSTDGTQTVWAEADHFTRYQLCSN